MFDPPGDDDFSIERPTLVWLGPPLAAMHTDIAETFDVCMVSKLCAALKAADTTAPAGLVCFLEACEEPADFVHLLLNRVLPEHRLVYVWRRGVDGWAQFRTRTRTTVLPGSFHESELVRAARGLVDPQFSLFPAPAARPRGPT